MKRITALAQIDYSTGYGIDACQKILGLINRGWNIYVRPTRFEDRKEGPVPWAIQERLVYHPTDSEWEIQITPPWMEPTKGKKTVLCTTLEATGTVKEAISVMSRVQAIIVPSQWNKQSIENLGIKTPVYVCPESIDSVFKYRRRRHKPDQPFVFGAAGNMKGNGASRKNFGAVFMAFLRAFPDQEDVMLKLKTDLGFGESDDPRVQIHTDHLTPQHLADWYASLDVFVSASKGEAWGRMVHEAMAVGRPVLGPWFGGLCDLVPYQDRLDVKYNVVPALDEYKGCGEWCHVDVDDLAKSMRELYEADLGHIGRTLSKHACRVSDSAAEKFENILLRDIGVVNHDGIVRFYEHKDAISDEDRIVRFYRDQDEVPKLPVPYEFQHKNLTNTPQGIGDTMLLTPFAKSDLMGVKVFSTAESFPTLMYFNPGHKPWIPRDLICADRLQKRYAMSNGHIIQRLHRVFGLEPPLKPKGNLEVLGIDRVKNRVAIHLLPGGHADWQKRYIHPRAREIYDETAKGLQEFVRTHGGYQFFEVGSKRSTWINEAQDKTGIGLFETIRFLATCDYFVGIISGPMHIATALDCKCIVILNFPDANQIFLPTLKDIPLVESEWLYPQNCHLHQESDGPLVKQFSVDNLKRAFQSEIYPYFSDRFLPLIHEKL